MLESASALQGLTGAPAADGGAPGLIVAELRDRPLWQIDAWPRGLAAVAARVDAQTQLQGVRALALGPGRWWLLGGRLGDAAALGAELSGGGLGTAVDLGHSRTALLLSGARAEWVLQAGIAVDLSLSACPQGTVLSTALAHDTAVVVHRLGEQQFEVFVYRSYAAHLVEWLIVAGAAHGVVIEA